MSRQVTQDALRALLRHGLGQPLDADDLGNIRAAPPNALVAAATAHSVANFIGKLDPDTEPGVLLDPDVPLFFAEMRAQPREECGS